MSSLSITLVRDDAREPRVVETATTGLDLFGDDKTVVAAFVNGELRDLSHVLGEGDVVEPVLIDSPDGLAVLRHSAAHVAAQAVQTLHPDAKLGIGPPIVDGFYYDFDIAEPFTPEDLRELEKAMNRIVKERQRFRRREVSDDEARQELADEPYKLELIADKGSATPEAAGPDGLEGGGDAASVEVGAGQLTIYDNLRRDDSVAWKDLCRGPHLPHTGYIPAFALMRNSAAYWRGDQANQQLQRLYGTAWPSREALKAYQTRLEEAAKRDHRKLGAELDLFSFPDELGSGLAVFHPRGGRAQARDGGLRPAPAHRGGLLLRRHAAHLQAGPVRDVRPPAVLRGQHVPADGDGGRELLPQGHELPDAQPDLPLARTVLPRAAAAAVRVRQRLPLREVGRRARSHPRPRPDAGRLPLLRHPRAGARGDPAPARTSCWGCCATSG